MKLNLRGLSTAAIIALLLLAGIQTYRLEKLRANLEATVEARTDAAIQGLLDITCDIGPSGFYRCHAAALKK